MTASRAIRVLHLIDGLEGGGSERLLFDLVRLSEGRVHHRVMTIYRESAHQVGPFVYAAGLRELGAYRAPPRIVPRRDHPIGTIARSAIAGGPFDGLARAVWTAGTVLGPGIVRSFREALDFRPDIIHAHLYYAFVCGLVLGRLTGRPLVHTVPAMFAQMHDVSWMPALYARSHPLVARFFTDYPNELHERGVPAAKIRRATGGIDRASSDKALAERQRYRAEIRARLGTSPGAPIALSVGRLHPSKGHQVAARAVAIAARLLPDLHWVVLGEGTLRGQLESLVRELGIVDRAHLVGFTSDVLPWYAAADIYVRSTLIEADNLSSRQAMAMALPVVGFKGTSSTELLELVGHGIAVPDQDTSLMAIAIVQMFGSEDRGRALGVRGQEYARAELGIERLVDLLVSSYEDLAPDRARG